MTVISATFTNYKKHRDFKASPNGKSFAIVGDIEEGKSTFIEAIQATLMLKPFDNNPLSYGAEAGAIEVTHDFGDGHLYTVKRRFTKKGLLRIEVTDENGGDHSLKPLLERLLGKAFANSYFDYQKYFYECKSSEARTEYFIKSIGREDVLQNIRKIKARITERNQVGGEKETYETLIENSILNPDTLEEDTKLYKEYKPLEAISEYEPLKELQQQLKDKEQLQADYDLVKTENEEFDTRTLSNQKIADRLIELEKELKELKAQRKINQTWLNNNPPDKEYEAQLKKELDEADEFNREIELKMYEVRSDGIQAINDFNQRRHEFISAVALYKKLMEHYQLWEDIDKNIDELRETNKQIFKESLPLPELSVEDDIIMYKCNDDVYRELCFPNISKGRSIIVTAQIQRVINPKGNNLIIIPEGNLLGSGMQEIAEELNKFGVQYIVELTEPKQKLLIRFEEEYIKK